MARKAANEAREVFHLLPRGLQVKVFELRPGAFSPPVYYAARGRYAVAPFCDSIEEVMSKLFRVPHG